MIDTDFLVIGSGISGLTYAIKVAELNPKRKITIVTKDSAIDSNTRWAQGGIAIVTNLQEDSYESHIQDTLKTGNGLCDEKVVRFVIQESTERLKEFISWGMQFDKTQEGNFDLGKEGGHSSARVVHFKDITGLEIEKSLINKLKEFSNITILENHIAIDLITDHHIGEYTGKNNITCFGAYIFKSVKKEIIKITARITIIAAGGAGQVLSLIHI